jgi:hypothetical protein
MDNDVGGRQDSELPSRSRPLSTRAADDALPATPKYKTLTKEMYLVDSYKPPSY